LANCTVAFLVSALLCATTSATAASAADPATYVLTLDDMPPGFIVETDRSGPTPNDRLAALTPEPAASLARFQSLGRTGGHIAAFARPTMSALRSGSIFVQSWVSLFSEASNADLYIDDIHERETGAALSMPKLGERSFANRTVLSPNEDGTVLVTHRVVFRIGAVVAGIDTASAEGLDNAEETLRMAWLVEARIAAQQEGLATVGGDHHDFPR
jgi:hypothetical protein